MTTAPPTASPPPSRPGDRGRDRLIIGRLEAARRASKARPPRPGGEAIRPTGRADSPPPGEGAAYPYVGSGIGRGPLVELVDGSVKWDLINGIGVRMFGHSDPGMVRAALESALGDVVMEGNLQFNTESIAFSELEVEQAARGSRLAMCS